MKCYTHKDADAVAVCVHCGKALCSGCAAPSPSGRLVCSPACATASKQLEEFVASTRNKVTRGARTASYFCFGLGLVFVSFAVVSYSELHKWGLTGFLGAAGIVSIVILRGTKCSESASA